LPSENRLKYEWEKGGVAFFVYSTHPEVLSLALERFIVYSGDKMKGGGHELANQ
jgi:hypothetical protein